MIHNNPIYKYDDIQKRVLTSKSLSRKSSTLSLLITDSDFVVVSGSDLVFAQEFCLFA